MKDKDKIYYRIWNLQTKKYIRIDKAKSTWSRLDSVEYQMKNNFAKELRAGLLEIHKTVYTILESESALGHFQKIDEKVQIEKKRLKELRAKFTKDKQLRLSITTIPIYNIIPNSTMAEILLMYKKRLFSEELMMDLHKPINDFNKVFNERFES